MIGRIYRWRGLRWMVLTHGRPFDRGPRRNVLLARVIPVAGYDPRDPRLRFGDGGAYLLTDERVVRPFRGLRRIDR